MFIIIFSQPTRNNLLPGEAKKETAFYAKRLLLQKHIVKVFELLQKNKPRLDALTYACLIRYY